MLLKVMRLLALIAGLLAPGLAHAADPTRFTVEVKGRGPDVILIPGLASSRAVWDGTARALEGRYRLHIVQVNGFAGAPVGGNAEGPIVDGMVEELSGYIRDQRLDHPAVIGHSMGGFTALALAERHPDQVGKAMVVDALPFFSVLINPAATAETIKPQAEMIRGNFLAMSDADFASLQGATMKRLVKGPQGYADALKWSLESDRGVMGQATYEIMTSDLRGRLAGIPVPITVVYARDASMGFGASIVDGVYRDNYAALPDKRLVRIDGALHFVMLDQPDLFIKEVEAFLQ
ncbi:MAG: alpha/beta fold hydrolase [Caulobacter sp.]|nr:alpha/beta fold hydrolase [Caulobacter sp.]